MAECFYAPTATRCIMLQMTGKHGVSTSFHSTEGDTVVDLFSQDHYSDRDYTRAVIASSFQEKLEFNKFQPNPPS